MLHAEEIAAADPRVGYLVMGTSDLAKELHAAHTPERLPLITGREGRADLRPARHAGARGAPRASPSSD
jgi:citrate lyase beta subunit